MSHQPCGPTARCRRTETHTHIHRHRQFPALTTTTEKKQVKCISSGHSCGEKALTICATDSWLLGDTPTSRKGPGHGGGGGAGGVRALSHCLHSLPRSLGHSSHAQSCAAHWAKVTSRQNPYVTSQENRRWRVGQWGSWSSHPTAPPMGRDRHRLVSLLVPVPKADTGSSTLPSPVKRDNGHI